MKGSGEIDGEKSEELGRWSVNKKELKPSGLAVPRFNAAAFPRESFTLHRVPLLLRILLSLLHEDFSTQVDTNNFRTCQAEREKFLRCDSLTIAQLSSLQSALQGRGQRTPPDGSCHQNICDQRLICSVVSPPLSPLSWPI